jgi:hypothetical protein
MDPHRDRLEPTAPAPPRARGPVLPRRAGLALAVLLSACVVGSTEEDVLDEAFTSAHAAALLSDPDLEATASGELQLESELGVHYNEVFATSIHNAYNKYETILDQLVYHKIRSVEFDIVPTASGDDRKCQDAGLDCDARPDDWFVYHEIPGIDDDAFTTCLRLSDCLDMLRTFHLMQPTHAPITVFVDMKRDVFEEGSTRSPSAFDARVRKHLDDAWIFKPDNLVTRCFGPYTAHTLRDAVETCGWPTLADLRGKFIVVLTGGESKADTYVSNGAVARSRAAFVSRKEYWYAKHYQVFFNLTQKKASEAFYAQADGFVTRMYHEGTIGAGGINSESDLRVALANNVNFIATDRVNRHKDPDFASLAHLGYPFQCVKAAGCSTDTWRESGEVSFTVDVSTKTTIGGTRDNFAFVYENNLSATNQAYLWTAHVGNSNAFIDRDAPAGCLMVRATTEYRAAPFFAVCRRGEKRPAYAIWRESGFSPTYERNAPKVPGVNGAASGIQPYETQDGIGYLRILYFTESRCATGLVSHNGVTWVRVADACFSTNLLDQGVAVASDGTTDNRFAAAGPGRIAARFMKVTQLIYGPNWARTEKTFSSPAHFTARAAFDFVNSLTCWTGDDAAVDHCAGHRTWVF